MATTPVYTNPNLGSEFSAQTNQPTTPSIVFPVPGYTGTLGLHHGVSPYAVDIGACPSQPCPSANGMKVVSMTSGTVVTVFSQTGAPGTIQAANTGGNALTIQSNDGTLYYYAHMQDTPTLKKGDTVQAGQQIGNVDTTGDAAGGIPHLHIGIGPSIENGGLNDPNGGGGSGNILTGPAAGMNALNLLTSLQADVSTNPNAGDTTNQTNQAVNPPPINYDVTGVNGFTVTAEQNIQAIVKAAQDAGVDPFTFLAIASHESHIDNTQINPSSGACGLAQLDPCPGIQYAFGTPESAAMNAAAGAQILKWAQSLCPQGNVACQIFYYGGFSVGTGCTDYSTCQDSGYLSTVSYVTNAITQLKATNGQQFGGGAGTSSSAPSSGTPGVSVPGIQNAWSSCPPVSWDFGNINFLGNTNDIKINIPDFACIFTTTLSNMWKQITQDIQTWESGHIPQWTFVIVGSIIVFIAILGFALNTAFGQAASQTVVEKVGEKAGALVPG